MMIPDQTITTLYADSVALLLLGGMFVLAGSRWKQRDTEALLFKLLFLFSMINATGNAIAYSLHYQDFPLARPLALIACTILESSVLILLFVWLAYVDYALYHSRDHIRRAYIRWFLPVVLCVALLILNIFTGIVFTISEDAIFTPRLLFKLVEITEYAYLLASVFVMSRYLIRNGQPRFSKLWAFLVPILVGAFVTDLTPYSVRSLGIAIGIVLLFFSTENHRRFLDPKTGFYNEEYLRWLFTVPGGEGYFGGAVLFYDCKEPDRFTGILKKEAPEGAELICLSDGRILLLSKVDKKSVLRLLSDTICFAAEDAEVLVEAKEQIRRADETPRAFVADICGGSIFDAEGPSHTSGRVAL